MRRRRRESGVSTARENRDCRQRLGIVTGAWLLFGLLHHVFELRRAR